MSVVIFTRSHTNTYPHVNKKKHIPSSRVYSNFGLELEPGALMGWEGSSPYQTLSMYNKVVAEHVHYSVSIYPVSYIPPAQNTLTRITDIIIQVVLVSVDLTKPT